MKIESKTVEIKKGPEAIYGFLQDMNNFKELLPQDKISEWQADEKSCSFKVQGAATIGIERVGGTEPGLVNMKSTDRSPFPFTLDVHLDAIENGGCKAHQLFEADINAFLKMMVEKPLKNLFDHIADRMVEIHN